MAIATIARLTLHEASRRKLFLAVAILTVLVALLSGWAFHRLFILRCTGCTPQFLKEVGATLTILMMFMFSFVLALGGLFLGAPSVAGDIESGVVLAILPRPIRRSDVIIGKWLGLSTLLVMYAVIACTLEFVILRIALDYTPPHPALAILFIIGEGVAILTITTAASTRIPAMTCGIVVLITFGLSWIGGVAGAVGAAFHSQAIENIGTVSSLLLPTDGLWRGALYNLEPAALIATAATFREAAGNPFIAGTPPAAAYVVWSILWIVGVLGLATWSFKRREL